MTGCGEAMVIPKLNVPISPNSDRVHSNDEANREYSILSTVETNSEQTSNQSWMSPLWLQVSEESIIDPFETNIVQNPLDGPSLNTSPLKRVQQPLTMSTPVRMISAASKCDIDKISNYDTKLSANPCQLDTSHVKSSNESSDDMEVSDLVVSSAPFICENQLKYLPIPGLCPLNALGFQSEQDDLILLQQKV